MSADPKPAARIVDPELVAGLHDVWDPFGCALCGYVPGDSAPDGARLEMAHIEARSRGGDDVVENLLAMCGELTPNKCHSRYDRHRIAIKLTDDETLVWMSSEPGGHVWQPVRIPPELLSTTVSVTNGEGEWVEPAPDEVIVVPASQETSTDLVVSEQPPPAEGEAHTPPFAPAAATAESRYERLTTLLRRSREDMIEAACHLHAAWEGREYERLGVDWPSYYSGLGLDRSAVSKMLRVGGTFASSWRRLPDADRRELSVERLYLAARLIDTEQLDPDEAMSEAVAHPTAHLVARLKGDEPAEKCKCTCPTCGREDVWHTRA